MKYKIKFKAKQNFRNVRNGKRFTRGKTYTIKASPTQYRALKSAHKSRGYVLKQPYKILSIRKLKRR